MSDTTARFSMGLAAWLKDRITGQILPGINTDLALYVKSTAAAPQLTFQMGKVPATLSPCLSISYSDDTPARLMDSVKSRDVRFVIWCLVPLAGDCTPMNFEIVRQVTSDHVTTWFDTDANALTPKIDGGMLGAVTAVEAERGPLVDIFPFTLADHVTEVHGWQMPYTAKFAINTR